MTFDDDTSLGERAKVIELAAAQRDAVVKSLMSTTAGRDWVFQLLAEWGVNSTPFTNDPYQTSFNCGMQNAGLRLQAMVVSAAPGDFITMLKEHDDDRLSDSDSGDAS